MAVISGTNDSETLFGTEEDDQISGLGGDDVLAGLGGSDTIDGGEGNDAIAGNEGSDVLTGGAGNDGFEWNPFDGTSTAAATDAVTDFQGAGNSVGDTLEFVSFFPAVRFTFGGRLTTMPALGSPIGTSGDSLAAVFYAFSGGNTFVFADTNDNGTYDADDFTVRLSGRHNLVQSDFGSTQFVIAGTNGPDTINGTPGNDTILALGGNDTVNGRGGDDVIEGDDGSDTLNGNDGVDRIEGGFDAVDAVIAIQRVAAVVAFDHVVAATAVDRVVAAQGEDRIVSGGAVDWVRACFLTSGTTNCVLPKSDWTRLCRPLRRTVKSSSS